MQIFISGLETNPSKTIVYDCTYDTKVSDLKDFIKTKYKYPDNVYILKAGGKMLTSNDKTFKEYEINDFSTIRFTIINRVNFNTMDSYLKYKICKNGIIVDNDDLDE